MATACPNHKPVQHRDGKEPWCRECGLTKDYRIPKGRLYKRPSANRWDDIYGQVSVWPHDDSLMYFALTRGPAHVAVLVSRVDLIQWPLHYGLILDDLVKRLET